jgi:hypothetical protein
MAHVIRPCFASTQHTSNAKIPGVHADTPLSHHVPSVSGLNEGVWFMYGEEETYVLKLVKCQRIACHAGGPKPSAISCVTQIIC